jgi:EAL domain-containing protein (putative c-di-GMP-specific phosphodiesterase class I)
MAEAVAARVAELATGEERFRAIVASIVRVARAHGLATVAEFVASAPVLALMQELGVDYAQGYAVEEPRPLADWGRGIGLDC